MPSLEDEVSLNRLGYSLAFLSGSYMSCAVMMLLYLLKVVGNTNRQRTILEDVFCSLVFVFCVQRTVGMPLRVFSSNYSRFVNIMQDIPIFLYCICYSMVLFFWSKRMYALIHPPTSTNDTEDKELKAHSTFADSDDEDEEADDDGFGTLFESADVFNESGILQSTCSSSHMSSMGSTNELFTLSIDETENNNNNNSSTFNSNNHNNHNNLNSNNGLSSASDGPSIPRSNSINANIHSQLKATNMPESSPRKSSLRTQPSNSPGGNNPIAFGNTVTIEHAIRGPDSRFNSRYTPGSRYNSVYNGRRTEDDDDTSTDAGSTVTDDMEGLIVPNSRKKKLKKRPREKVVMMAGFIAGIVSAFAWIVADTQAYITVKNQKQDLTLEFSETSSLMNLSVLGLIHAIVLIYFNRKIDKKRRKIEIHLQQMRKILRTWALSIVIRAIVSATVLYYDWIDKYFDWVWLIYPPLYFLQEVWAVIYLEYKLIQHNTTFVLDVDAVKIDTFFDPRTENPQVFICKRQDNVLAVKSSASVREIQIMQRIRGKHPQIINYVDHEEFGSLDGQKKLYLFMECMPNIPLEPPTLYNYIRNSYVQTKNGLKNRLSFGHLLHVALKVAKGIQFLHENNIAHLDIKSDNILVMPHVMENRKVKLIVKIIDFGLAEIMKPNNQSGSGHNLVKTRRDRHRHVWVHPDMFEKEYCDGKKADVYSFGYLLCVIFGNRDFNSRLHSGHIRDPISRHAFEGILNSTLLELLRSKFLQMDPTIKQDVVFLYQMCVEDCRPIEEICEKIKSILAQLHEALENTKELYSNNRMMLRSRSSYGRSSNSININIRGEDGNTNGHGQIQNASSDGTGNNLRNTRMSEDV